MLKEFSLIVVAIAVILIAVLFLTDANIIPFPVEANGLSMTVRVSARQMIGVMINGVTVAEVAWAIQNNPGGREYLQAVTDQFVNDVHKSGVVQSIGLKIAPDEMLADEIQKQEPSVPRGMALHLAEAL
jgi:hypothetical protein